MKPLILLHITVLVIVASCSRIPLSLTGDDAEYLYATMAGNWNSWDNAVQFQFHSRSNFIMSTNNTEYSKGFYGLTAEFGYSSYINGGIYFITTHLNTGGSWSNVAIREMMPYMLYDKGLTLALNPFMKTDGAFQESQTSGKYYHYYIEQIRTNNNHDWVQNPIGSSFESEDRRILSISGPFLHLQTISHKSYTNNGNQYFDVLTRPLTAYRMSIPDGTWGDFLYQYNTAIYDYQMYNSIATNFAITNIGPQSYVYHLKLSIPKGMILYLGSYSNKIFKKN